MHYLLLEAPNEFSSLKKLVMIIILTFGSIEKIRSFFFNCSWKRFQSRRHFIEQERNFPTLITPLPPLLSLDPSKLHALIESLKILISKYFLFVLKVQNSIS